MPEVIIKAKREWCPDDDGSTKIGPDVDPRKAFIYWLQFDDQLPAALSQILGEYDPEPFGTGAVVIDFESWHSASTRSNVPDAEVKVVLVSNPGRLANRANIVDALATAINEMWDKFVPIMTKLGVAVRDRPQVDINIIIHDGCGAAIGKDGRVTSVWPAR